MATVDGQQLNIERMEIDRSDEQSLHLSNGLIFRSKYDQCSNTTISTMHSPDGSVLGSMRSPETGNFVRECLEKMEILLNSHESIEDLRDKALKRIAISDDILQQLAECS